MTVSPLLLGEPAVQEVASDLDLEPPSFPSPPHFLFSYPEVSLLCLSLFLVRILMFVAKMRGLQTRIGGGMDEIRVGWERAEVVRCSSPSHCVSIWKPRSCDVTLEAWMWGRMFPRCYLSDLDCSDKLTASLEQR